MNEKVKEHLIKLLGDDYTEEIQLQVEESIIDSNISSIIKKITEITGKSKHQLWKKKATPEQLEKKNQTSREYYQQHKDEWLSKYYQTVLDYQERNKEKLQAYRKEYYKEYWKTHERVRTPEQQEADKLRQRKYYDRNKERLIQAAKDNYEKNKDNCKARYKKRYAEMKEKKKLGVDYTSSPKLRNDKPYVEGDENRNDNF